MNIVACYKIVPDAQDIEVGADGALRLDRAQWVLGEYDLVAIEAAAQLAAATDGSAVLLSAGGEKLNDTKLVKAALSRGADELYRVVDPALEDADAFQTASVLAAALRKIDFDLVVCGEGSADRYSQQVGLLVGALLGLPVVNATGSVRAEGDAEYMRILSEVYDSPEEAEFYTFMIALDALQTSMTGAEKTLILDADSPIAKLFY